ncbi:hypothetical protein [Alcaligenes faecalis]|jgi:uncharacterized lipoprotein YbaY|uniref:hypothetical protein n=1 Tax=Alcaligenes faecalis TaxID=511 RepID=UPI0034D4CC42
MTKIIFDVFEKNNIEIKVRSKGSNKFEFTLFQNNKQINDSLTFTLSFIRSVEDLRFIFSNTKNFETQRKRDDLNKILLRLYSASSQYI